MTSAVSNKILGQAVPAANTIVTLYTPAASIQAQLNLFITNLDNANNDNYYIALVPSGQTLANQHYIAYNFLLEASSSGGGSIRIPNIFLASGDMLQVKSVLGNLAFTANGLEYSP